MATAAEEWHAKIAAKMESQQCSKAKATVLVARENPELRKRFVDEFNTYRRG